MRTNFHTTLKRLKLQLFARSITALGLNCIVSKLWWFLNMCHEEGLNGFTSMLKHRLVTPGMAFSCGIII
jgi:hypothetical protein